MINANIKTKNFVSFAFYKLKSKYGEDKIDYPTISKVIKTYHQLAREDLALGEEIALPKNLGMLYLVKKKREVIVKEDGTIINNLPINRAETFKLWRKKPELKGKTFIRFVNAHSDGYSFRLKYRASIARFNNKHIYNFQFNDTLKRLLAKNIKDNKTDAYEEKDYFNAE